MKLVKKYTIHGDMWIDLEQLDYRTILTIYNKRGGKVSEVGRTKEIRNNAMYGVHKANLFDSKSEAISNYEKISKEILK
jgi:hypothetical protein